MAKIHVGLIFGGDSPEHDVSIMTAKSIRENIDREKFEVVDIFIDTSGKLDEDLLKNIDVAFLAVHGPNCEDGKLQKYLEDRHIRYTGPGVEASRINMDKIDMHHIFKKNGLPVVDYKGFKRNELKEIKKFVDKIGFPVFVKPNNAGSSIGIDRAATYNGLKFYLKRAFEFDDEIIIEKAVECPREIEIGVLGNKNLIISGAGEVLTHGKFYSYTAKYFKPFKTTVKPRLDDKIVEKIKKLAKNAYLATGCSGYARVDFLMDSDDNIYLNEINTLPGFTSISMFPKLMAEIGIEYKELITRIINLALE